MDSVKTGKGNTSIPGSRDRGTECLSGRQAREVPPDPTTLGAGPELDALIAEKVMGWERRPRWSARKVRELDGSWRWLPAGPVAWFEPGNDRAVAEVKSSENCVDCGDEEPAWSPSTDIAAAWRVVEKVQERNPGWRFALLGGDISFRSAWRAEFFGHIDPSQNYGQRHGEAYEIAAPLAICRAALKAVFSM